MRWFKKNTYENIPKLPTIDEISKEIPAVSEYLEASSLPDAFRIAESDTLPVIDVKGDIVGIVSEYDLAQILPEWSFEDESYRINIAVAELMTKNVWTETEHTNIKDLLSSIHKMHTRVIPIVDNKGKYTGRSITRTAIISYLTRMVKPRSIGGLATPLGIYMTDGRHQAGSGNLGLISTGFTFGIMVIIIQVFMGFVTDFIKLPELVIIIAQLVLFLLFLRLTPLVKYHAAEHQTIHAIEKGLPLTPGTVRMQPRPHRRCGTNIMVLLIGIQFVLLISIAFLHRNPFFQFVFLIVGFLFVFSNWRKAGMWLQEYITTKPASEKQINNGIKTGEELLQKYKNDTNPKPPGILEKIWNMGLVQIILTFMLTIWIFDSVLYFL